MFLRLMLCLLLLSFNHLNAIFFFMVLEEEINGCSDLVHWEDPEGSGGEGGGRGDRDGEYM